jgi:hypothetical protein
MRILSAKAADAVAVKVDIAMEIATANATLTAVTKDLAPFRLRYLATRISNIIRGDGSL